MSAQADHAQVHPAADAHGEGVGHGTFKGYMTGFVLSVILTAIPFILVMGGMLSNVWTIVAILALGVAQIIVHMVYFLHMSTKAEGGWMVMAMIFTVTLVLITLVGSIWIMYHLDTNMMPVSGHDMRHHP